MNQSFGTKIFGHMSWANQQLFNILKQLSDSEMNLTRPNSEWTVGAIAKHIVDAESMLIARLTSQSPNRDREPLTKVSEISALSEKSLSNGKQLLELISRPENSLTFGRPENQVTYAASTILAQAIHHASEHRAQIADILAVNGKDVVNLDAIDVWSYEKHLNS